MLLALTVAIVAGGLENIGIVTFQKELRFADEVRFLFLKRVTAVVVSVAAAIAGATYRSLVIGTIAGRLSSVVPPAT